VTSFTNQVLIICAPWGWHWQFWRWVILLAHACWVASPLFEGGRQGWTHNHPQTVPPSCFFACALVLLSAVAVAAVAAALAAAVAAAAVAAAAVGSAACVATAESTTAVIAVADTVVAAASHLVLADVAVVAVAGALHGLWPSFRLSTQATILPSYAPSSVR
jgi:hypothetical protein